jgi:hypothetical protein
MFNGSAIFADPGMQGVFINTNIPCGLSNRFGGFVG